MTALAYELPVTELGAMMRRLEVALRDREWEGCPIGGEVFKRCVRRAGLPESMMMHEMRHSAADALHRDRGDVSLAQQLLRHSSIATTEAYLHPTKRDLADALQALEETWRGVTT
jgi:hypothetical protein